ncbi:HAD family hydrolase [Prolixibacteraceae bacterium JC049]|nr:HAD family hydrolase [Prolixibacteraceae bacterium JC049]
MQHKKVILFDLDGTITQSEEGILNSIIYTLKKYGREVPEKNKLKQFIGPPLHESFMRMMGVDEAEGYRAVDVYREYYATKGIFENEMYEGIPELLLSLVKKGCKIALATSKPQKYAAQILAYFKIDRHFDSITGAFMDGTRTDKKEIIEHVLSIYTESEKADLVMIGDRRHDIIGAVFHNVDSIGVTYGYGSKEELDEAGATKLVSSVSELKALLLK